ncbi:MAG: hypothetical protein COT61_04270 [Candidatus Portnoybacteria bacterium CG09_land_8_20_14_0_10_44_13]|uniref:PPM-type phosphatase domain-containing protein n=1 Tax=Candidatus Portnoybacteria bacterium CG09_land_8_20_14_0_10_44_13 TaxID=1974811 RepID=A0A2H0WUS7_9BACT|nr:MAG: hypothetical protein COT61_04270 [Candidatus Portnoybacteria bacterium CG09_land_8_20_14_0_10_44_13]
MPTEEKKIQPKIKEIVIKGKEHDAEKGKIFCETFSYQPENVEEIGLGNLYIAGRIESDSSEPSHILNLLSAVIKREYYSQPKRKPANSLREGLKKANSTLADLTKTDDSSWLNKTSFICIAMAGNNLYFTKVGEAKILLLRDAAMTDLSKKLISDHEKISPQKAFQSIASGKICLGDQIILTTADVFQHISQKGLKQILERKDVVQLEKTLQETKNISSQGIIIIEAVSGEKTPSPDTETIIISVPQKQTAQFQHIKQPNKIIDILRKNSKNAASEASLVLKSFALKTKGSLSKIKGLVRRTDNQVQQEKTMPAEIMPIARRDEEQKEEKQPSAQLPASPVLQRGESAPPPQPTPIISTEKQHPEKIIMKDISDKKEEILHLENTSRPEPKPIPFSVVEPHVAVKENQPPLFKPIEKLSRLSSAATWLRRISHLARLRGWQNQNGSTQTEIPQNLPVLASRRTMAPPLGQKYFPHKPALAAIISLAILIAGGANYFLRQKYQKQVAQITNDSQRFEADLRNIRKINLIEEPAIFASPGQEKENFSSSFLAISKDNLLSVDLQSPTLYLTLYLRPIKDAENGKFIGASMPTDKKWSGAALLNENTIVLMDSENNFYQYDFSSKNISPLSLKPPFNQSEIADFLIYSNNLYILDYENQQIIKCPDLGQCQPWLKEKISAPSSASFAADGSIYILNQQENTLIRYYNGRPEETFQLKISPNLSTVTRIKTDRGLNNLYLMDPTGQRVIVIDKKGELIKQYTSPKFTDMTDIEISSDESLLFVAANKKIYEINLKQ